MEQTASSGGAYGVQVLIAGRQKQWRDDVAAQIRRVGYATTTVDCGVDAMTVLALGLPVDVLVTDLGLKGELSCVELALEARALRPDLRIVFASEGPCVRVEPPGFEMDDLYVVEAERTDTVALTVREALNARA
ncbi:histidine kinase [Methylobacterium adhaesivum]|uniref:Histidine kinase n=1 Tax=Methylobacterium adhaesivum TaxID=333297 RepID=A0ABT8BE05_9HYPH|nr:histidine kinase [Methylobacterium adhaesivum]MDN3590069.1 histidine kinase [Methylobacterium adhaesivum]